MTKLLRLSVSLLLLGWIAGRTDWGAVSRAFAGLRVELWLASVGLLVVAQCVSARRWQLFARQMHFERPLRQLTSYYLIGMYFNLLLPTSVGGDVVRAWYLDAGSGRRWAALATVFFDRLNGLLVLVALACLALLCCPVEGLPGWVPLSVGGIAGCAAGGLLTLPLLCRWHFLPEPRQQQLRTLVQLLRAPGALAEATALSVFVQAANIVTVWLLGIALGLDVPLSYYGIFVPMVSLLTLLPVSLNGMGVREGGVALFLAPLGVSEANALTLAFLWFAVFGAVSLIGAVVYLCGAFPKPSDSISSEGTKDHGPLDRGADQGREGQPAQAA